MIRLIWIASTCGIIAIAVVFSWTSNSEPVAASADDKQPVAQGLRPREARTLDHVEGQGLARAAAARIS